MAPDVVSVAAKTRVLQEQISSLKHVYAVKGSRTIFELWARALERRSELSIFHISSVLLTQRCEALPSLSRTIWIPSCCASWTWRHEGPLNLHTSVDVLWITSTILITLCMWRQGIYFSKRLLREGVRYFERNSRSFLMGHTVGLVSMRKRQMHQRSGNIYA